MTLLQFAKILEIKDKEPKMVNVAFKGEQAITPARHPWEGSSTDQ